MQLNHEAVRKILVVDDDSRLQELTKTFLESFSYRTYQKFSGETLWQDVVEIKPDLVLLDIMMPGKDGISVLQNLRSITDTPVIMISARTEATDRILSLEMGADDYLSKPFNPYELLARIKSVLRRTMRQENKEPKTLPISMLQCGDFVLDGIQQRVVYKGKEGKLTVAEYRILLLLMQHKGKILSRETLSLEVSGNEYITNERNIDVHICRIRNICKRLGVSEFRLKTIRSAGYCWADES